MDGNRKNQVFALRIWIVCGVLFAVFCYGFLYLMQADLMAAAQHVLSHGKTVYSPFWGAFIITLLLSALPFCIAYKAVVPTWAIALLYFPSCLCLALLTSFCFSGEGTCVLSTDWLWGVPVLLFYALILKVLAQIPEAHSQKTIWGRLWPNVLLLAVFFGTVGICSNTDSRLHYELKAAHYLQDEDYEQALSVGKQSLEVSRRLTAMRCYALSRTGQLGERLFDYPMLYGSCGLLPSMSDSVGLSAWPDAFYRYMRARPSARLEDKATQFFRQLAERRDTVVDESLADYLLCAYLLDKNLDAFARTLSVYYAIDDSLPRSYKEALVLYTHVRMHPVLTYQNNVLQTNYSEYQAQRRKPVTTPERYKTCRRLYGTTYWFYYHFQ